MNKEEIYTFLKSKNIWYEITEHEAVFNMKELDKIKLPYPECDAKNLFCRDDKNKNYYLITVKKDKRVDLKAFQQQNNTRRLSFASPDDLKEILNLIPGSVTPLGLLNDANCQVKFYLDEYFLKDKQIIGIHPNDNTATVWLKVSDLIDIIKENGNEVNIIEVKE